MLKQIKMPSDGYKVKVIYYLNPHLIWIEVCDPNVTTDDYIFEQIGLYGILPLESTLDIEKEEIKVQKCDDWVIAATTLMMNELKETSEVWFTPTYIDRRTSIFDDNIHKYGELIIKSKNGELKQLSKLLINSNIAHFDVCEFHQKLSSGEIKTKLCSIKTQDVVKEIENYYTRTANSKISCKKSIAKQTSVFQIGQGLESALTVSNLERHNNKMLNTVLENKMKDLELCKDVDDESIGCGFRKSKDRTLESRSSSSVTINSKCNDAQELDQNFEDIKVFLDAKVTCNNKPSENVSEAVKISVDVKKPQGSMLIKKLKIMNQAERDKINKVRMKHKLNIEQQIDKTSISTVKPIERNPRNNHGAIESNDRKMQVVDDKAHVKNVAYGPPGMDPKLWKIEKVKQDGQGDVTEVNNVADVSEEMESESRNLVGDVDSEFSFEITNKKTLSDYCNTKLKHEVTSELTSDRQLNVQADSKEVALSYDNDDSSEIHKSLTSSLLLNKKLRAYSNMSKRNRSLSGSDTSNKDSSSVSDNNNCSDKDVNYDVIKRIAEQYKVIPSVKNKKKQNDVTPTRLKNNVNPFKNIDPNISVFVDKLVAPMLLVHTKKNKRIQPIFEMRDVFFNSHIHLVLKNMLIEHPMMVQSVSWNTILRGHSLFMISPPNSGKTLGYLPAVCRLISDVYSGNVDSVGPLCIIVCATAKSVIIVEEMAKMFLGLDDKILACYAGVDDFYITTKLLNGCDLLISTPASLIRLMQLCEFGVDLRRLSVFVFDDCERLAVTYADEIKFFLFKIKETVASRANNELKVQYILASRVWCDFFQPLAKKTPDTVISFSAFQECVPYSKADTSVSFVEIENKINVVFEFLQGIDESKKTVIVCKSDDEVDLLEAALKRSKRVVFACNNNMTVHDLYNLSISWAEFEEPLVGPILVCCDGNLTHMNITDAHHLIHYSLPQLFSMFCKRFCVLNDNYPSIFKDEKKGIKIKIILDGSNVEQLPKIMNFIKRCTNNSPKFLDEVCSKILKDKDLIKAKNYIPICNNLLMFGSCPDIFNCKERHTIIKEYDSPQEWMPKDGIITFRILHYHSAILYSARLLANVVSGVVTKYPQSYSSLFIKMGMYYSKESNRRLHGIPKIGDVCAASVKLNFYVRCQIVKILSHYQNGNPNSVLVNLIDEEKYEITRDIYLFYLPEELKEIKTPVVQVRLANVEPKDKDITFSNLAVEQFKKITDNNDIFIKGHVSLTLGNCVFVDTLEVCQELTSLNETVVKHNLKKELLENHAQLNPERLQQLKKLCTESGICYTEIVKEPEIQNPVKNLPKGSWAHLESGILSTVLLSSAKSPDKFFVRLNKFESCMSVLLQDIKEYSEAYILNNELSKVKEGDLVLAEFPDDLTYERARIDGISDGKAKCFFLDQGDWIEIPMNNIIPITEKFINKLPFQAIECRLIGIEPPGEDWSDFSKNWFCNNCFEDKNGDLKHLYIKYFTKEAAEFTGGHKYGVALIDTNTDNDVVINQLMIDLNLAKENIKEREYLNKLLPDAKESGHVQTFEEENSYLNLHPDTNESDHVETFEEVENEDDDEKMTKINQDIVSAGNSIIQIPQPIRSVPLVDSDSSDFERWDVNLDQSVLSTLFPRLNSNVEANVTQDIDDAVSTDEKQVIPFRSRDTNSEVKHNNYIQSTQNEPQELDSDDFTSSETSQTFNVCNDKPNLLSVVEQKRRPKLLWRQTKNVVFVKIELIDVKDYDLEFDVRNLKFSCDLNDATYEFDIELYGVIDRDKSSHVKTGLNIIVKLVKVLKTKWVSLTKSFDTKNWIAYDVDSIDTSSDEEEVDRSAMENIIKEMHGSDDESDDDEFLDDVNYKYGKHN